MRAGVLERPSKTSKGTVVLLKKDVGGDHQCLVAFAEEEKWCNADGLVEDAKDSVLEAHFARELALLKELYQKGRAVARSRPAFAEAVKRVQKGLEDQLSKNEKDVKELTGKEKQDELKRSVKSLF